MTVNSYNQLETHVGHDVEVVKYGERNVAIECETCGIVLQDYDKELPEEWEESIGERNQGDTYTKRFYHEEKDLEMEVYYDELGDDQHKVVIHKVQRNEEGDAEGSELMGNWYRGTEEEAMEKAKSLMKEISRGEKSYD